MRSKAAWGQITPPKATVHRNEDIAIRNVNELLSIQLVRSEQVILGQERLKAGSLSPHHNHPEEELVVVISGRLRVMTSDGDVVMEPGDVYVAEAYAEHQVEALEDSFTVVGFWARKGSQCGVRRHLVGGNSSKRAEAEQKKHIEQPKAFLFRIARNVALNELTRKSRQITDFIEEVSASVVLNIEVSCRGGS